MELVLIVLLAYLVGSTTTGFAAYRWCRRRAQENLRFTEAQQERLRFLEYLLLSQTEPRRLSPRPAFPAVPPAPPALW